MFEEIEEWEEPLRLLELETILAEHGKSPRAFDLTDEYYWDVAYSDLAELSDEIIYMESFDSTLYLFRFPQLHEFYTLCKEWSRKKGVNFRKSVYAVEAERFIRDILCYIHDYTFVWNLWVPKKLVKKRAYTFLIELGCDFYNYSDIIDSVLTIKEYYAEKCEELRKLLGKPKIVRKKNGKERKAA